MLVESVMKMLLSKIMLSNFYKNTQGKRERGGMKQQ